MERIISGRNAKILNHEETPPKLCNCRKNSPCPLEGQCLKRNIVYKATVTQNNGTKKSYIGLTSTEFKSRLAVHKHSFKNSDLNQTSLSQHIHELKNQNIEFNISWKIVDRGKPFSPVSSKCDLCTKEKYHIIFKSDQTHLNSRNEMYSNCRHKQSVLLVAKVRKKRNPG